MSNSQSKRHLPAQSQEAHADFNWPPTDEELAQCFNLAPADKELAQGGVESGHKETALDEEGVTAPLETSAAPPLTALLPPDVLTRDPEYGGIGDSIASDIAVVKHKPALDVTSAGEWAAAIAHLQALIEALTAKVEWRVTNVTRR